MAKKKISIEPNPELEKLLNRYWILIKKERIPNTPNTSKILDELEEQIKKLKK